MLLIGMSSGAVTVTIGQLKYELNGTEAYVSGYVGEPVDVVIPATIVSDGLTFRVTQVKGGGYSGSNYHGLFGSSVKTLKSEGENLVTISSFAFYNCTNLQEVNIPSIQTIGDYAFCGCTNLQKVCLGNSLTSIGINGFSNCSMMSYIVLPASCNISAPDYYLGSFYNCSRLQAIIYLGTQTGKGDSNADVYNVNNMVSWSENSFPYTGNVPMATFTNNLPMGFQPTNGGQLSNLEKDAGNYSQTVPITFANNDMEFTAEIPYSYTITPVPLKARVKDDSRVYGDPNPQFETEYTGFVWSEDASVITNPGTYTTTAQPKSDVGTYEVKQQGIVAKNYTVTYESGMLTVTKAPLIITALDKTMTYGDRVPSLDLEFSGLKNNETKPAWITEPTVSTTATQQSPAGSYPIAVAGGAAKNYSLTLKNGTLTINKANLTATVQSATRQYGDTNPSFTMTYSGLKNGETEPEWVVYPYFVTSAKKNSPVGIYNVTASGGEAENYNLTYENGTLTITKAPLTVTARNKTMIYGSQVPSLVLDYSGLKNNETKPEWITEPTITTTATSESPVGTYPITVTEGEAKNYSLTLKNGTLTINKANLTLTTMDATKQYGDDNPDFKLGYSGLKNDETEPEWVVYPTFSTSAKKTSPVGIYGIRASGGEAKNYFLHYVNTGELTVIKANLTVTARSYTKYQGESNPRLEVDYEGFKNNETKQVLVQVPVANTTCTQNSEPGTYPITVSGGQATNYDFIYVNGTLTVVKKEDFGDPTANTLSMPKITGFKGNQIILPIALANEDEITGLQIDLYLPEGVSVATKTNGKLKVETTDRMQGNYTVTANQWDDFVRIAGYSGESEAFTGYSGDILNVTLEVDENIADGDYTIRLRDIVLSDVDNKEYHPLDAETTITVLSYQLGDVDNSGAVNINDVVCIINYILHRPNTVFIEAAADVDYSGTININDVVTLVNRYILHRNTAPKRAPLQAIGDDNYLYLGTINIAPGEILEVPMLLSNMDEVRAVQGNVKLPVGLSFVTRNNNWAVTENLNERSEDFTLSCSVEEDGSMSFAQYSADGFAYEGSDGGIFKFKIQADANVQPGTYDVTLNNVVLSINGVGYDLDDRTSKVNVSGGATGIGDNNQYPISNNPETMADHRYYDLQGRKLNDMPTAKGIYVVGGKKVVNK